jgi:hypothetical protein
VNTIDLWDAYCDGMPGMLGANNTSVAWYEGPWTGDRDQGDRDLWFGDGNLQASRLDTTTDLDGDGCSDLFIGSFTNSNVSRNAGSAFVALAGTPEVTPLDDLPITVVGNREGEALAYGIAAGDFDGDGTGDLVLGAPAVSGGLPGGSIRLYLGPLEQGVYERSDADHVMRGERAGDFFGRSMVVVDGDGDAQDDLVVAASSAYRGGALYLIRGVDWLP